MAQGFASANGFELLGGGDDPDTMPAPAAQPKAARALPRSGSGGGKQPQQTQQRQRAAGSQGGGSSSGGASASGAASASSTGGGAAHTARALDFYRCFQKVFVDPASGEVVLRFHRTDVVRIRPAGDVMLHTGGHFTQAMLLSMNDALRPLGMQLTASPSDLASGAWQLCFDDGSAAAYRDGMVLRTRGPGDAGRAMAVLTAYCGSAAAAAAAAAAAGHAALARGGGSGGGSSGQQQPRQQQQPNAWAAAAAARVAPSRGPPAAHAGTAAPAPVAAATPAGAPQAHTLATPAAAQPKVRAARGAAAAHDDLDDDEACVVCLAARRSVVLVPCGHMVLCPDCCGDIMAATSACPMCRTAIEDVVRLDDV